MSSFKRLIVFTIVFTSAFVSGCQPDTDYYTQLFPYCGDLSAERIGTPAFRYPAGYTEDCRKALTQVISFDESFDSAPEEAVDRVLRAIQVLIAYPLKADLERRLFDSAPNTVPLALVRIFSPDLSLTNNLNQAAVNYLLNSIDRFDYSPSDGTRIAEFFYKGTQKVITIHDRFLDTDYVPTTAAAVLMHEARHSDGIAHTPCGEGGPKGQHHCDNELFGAYGFQALYINYLILGSINVKDTQGDYILTSTDIPFLTWFIGGAFSSIQGVELPRELQPWTAETRDLYSRVRKYRTSE